MGRFRLACLALLLTVGPVKGQSPPPIPRGADNVDIRVFLHQAPGGAIAAYSVNNYGMSSLNDARASLWLVDAGRLQKIHERAVPYTKSGEYFASDRIATPVAVGRYVVCVTLKIDNEQIEILSFFSNEGHSSYERQIGKLTEFREKISSLGEDKGLCRNMPRTAETLVR